jgi:hypothetical protein
VVSAATAKFSVTQQVRHVDITFSQQDGACLDTANVVLNILHDVFGNHVSLN